MSTETKAKHTPGPWTVEHHGGPWHIFGAGDTRVGTYGTSVPAITEAEWATSQANAHLIAAAPELYAALQAVDAEVRDIPSASGDVILPSHVWDLVSAALAKAEAR